MSCPNCISSNNNSSNQMTMEDYLKRKNLAEDQIDYQFIQRVIQE